MKSLSDFAAGLDENLLLCPVRALCIYLDRTRPLAPVCHRLLVSPRRPSGAMPKNAVSFFCARPFMRPGRLDMRWVPCVPMRFVVSPPLSRFTETDLSLRFWSPPLGAPVRYLLPFTFATFSMNTMAFARWVRSWLRVRGSSSPHLFLTCSGGGGGAPSPLSPLPRGSCTCLSCWMWGLPIQLLAGAGEHPFVFFIPFLMIFSLLVFSLYLFLCVSQPKTSPVGLCYLDA